MQIAYAAGDDVLVTGGYDQAIRLWDCRSRSFDPIQTMKSFGDSVTSVAVADRHVTAARSASASLMMQHTCWAFWLSNGNNTSCLSSLGLHCTSDLCHTVAC